jgi:hypothetical protein
MKLRFKKYICESSKAKKGKWNPTGCLYEGWPGDGDVCIYCNKSYDETRTIWHIIYMALPRWIKLMFDYPHKKAYNRMKWFWQRRTRGFDDRHLWSMHVTFARFIAPRVRAFIDTYNVRSVPQGLNSKQWRRILEKIYFAFNTIANDDFIWEIDKKQTKKVDEGLDLFRKWYFHLWD